jgi:hypothetical protein
MSGLQAVECMELVECFRVPCSIRSMNSTTDDLNDLPTSGSALQVDVDCRDDEGSNEATHSAPPLSTRVSTGFGLGVRLNLAVGISSQSDNHRVAA